MAMQRQEQEQEPHALTTVGLAALRMADGISFRSERTITDGGWHEYSTEVIAIRRGDAPTATDPFRAHRAEVIVTGGPAWVTDYQAGGTFSPDQPPAILRASIYSAQQSDEWMTVVGLLRAGDILSLRWILNNSSLNLDKAGLVRDELAIRVHRGNKTTMTFVLEVMVTPTDACCRWGSRTW